MFGKARVAPLVAVALIGGATGAVGGPEEARFLAESHAAMAKMMTAMDCKPAGTVDADFVAMMAAHHQGAIDMAQAQLRYGHNEQLRRLAQEIIVTQQQEIAAMRVAIGQPPLSVPSADHASMVADPPATSHQLPHLCKEP